MTKKRPLDSFPEPLRLYIELLRSNDPEARHCALSELAGRLDDPLAEELLRLLQASRDLDFRLQILEQLSLELGGIVPDTVWEERLELGTWPEGAAEMELPASGGLSQEGLARVLATLEATYRSDKEPPRLRRKALETAVLLPLPWQEEVVRECFIHPEPEWQATALFCMGHLFPLDFAEEIDQGLASPLDGLRIQAIVAADARDLRSLGPRILRIAADAANEIELRLTAIEALASLRPAGAAALLEKLRAEAEPIGHFAADALYNLEQNMAAARRIAEERGDPQGPAGALPALTPPWVPAPLGQGDSSRFL